MIVSSYNRSRGLTLVEMLVGVVIGMIGILVIMQVATTFEAQKRTTVGTAESMDEGAIGLYTMRREIQGAGYGIVDRDLIGCLVRAHSANPDAPLGAYDFSYRITPVTITQGARDSIQVVYSSSPMTSASSRITTKFTGDEVTNIQVSNRYGFDLGNVLILAESGKDCSQYEVTGLPATVGETNQVVHRLEKYTKIVAGTPQQIASRYNKAGGLGIEYNIDAKIFNIGGRPVVNVFRVCSPGDPLPCTPAHNNHLVFVNGLDNSITALIDNVVDFQAQYGFDARAGLQTDVTIPSQNYVIGTGGFSDAMVDADSNAATGDAGDWLRIGAVRVAIVVRNKYPDRPDAGGNCQTTTALPTWSWGSVAVGLLPADWGCFRYKVFEGVIPIRNMFWKTTE